MTAPVVFDLAAHRQRRRRALRQGPETFLIARAAEDLLERLVPVTRHFDVAVDLFTPTLSGAQALRASGKAGTVIAVRAPDVAPKTVVPTVTAPEEAIPLRDQSVDLVASLLALQSVNDLPGLLVQIRRALKPDGLFIAALLGGDTLTELRQAFAAAEMETEGGISPRVAPFGGVREMGALLQRAGFALPVSDVDHMTVRYSSPFALLQDLRRMGATNCLAERRRVPLKRRTLVRMAEIYAERFSDVDGRVRATFDMVWLSGWAPHESQQKPLRPGSARMRLAEALGTKEIPLPGES